MCKLPYLRPLEEIEREMLAKKETLERVMNEGRPPERKVGWLCSYCNLRVAKWVFMTEIILVRISGLGFMARLRCE